jgi:hypothetical protein
LIFAQSKNLEMTESSLGNVVIWAFIDNKKKPFKQIDKEEQDRPVWQ